MYGLFACTLQVTPYLLDRIRVLTGGKSLDANVKLVKNNATVGSKIAAAYAAMEKTVGGTDTSAAHILRSKL